MYYLHDDVSKKNQVKDIMRDETESFSVSVCVNRKLYLFIFVFKDLLVDLE